ncbi:MAG: hypothetical protein GC129_06250 [Proteobacteria bacterium]|nr:hypothetical protein [Pseudomonadota bacterium]
MSQRYRRSRASKGVSSSFAGSLLPYIDFTSLMFAVFLVMFAATLPFINAKARDIAEKRVPGPPTPLEVVLGWSGKTPVDADLWVACQSRVDGIWSDGLIVYYNRRSDRYLDLQRDDQSEDRTLPFHYEIVRTNSHALTMPANTRCWVNVHMFALNGVIPPVPIWATVTLNRNALDGSEHMILPTGKAPVLDDRGQPWAIGATATQPAQELNLVFLQTDGTGKLVPEATETYPGVAPCAIARNKLPPGERRCGHG